MEKNARSLRILLAAIILLLAVSALIYRQYTCTDAFASRTADTAAGTKQEELNLYARSAVLMDADSGRILYAKDGDTPMPMASTTKIMTLIVALEQEAGEETATVSTYAAGQPKVHLGMYAGETFRLQDLYYSLMLESHNDTAVCIAEHLGKRMSNPDSSAEEPSEQEKDGNDDAGTETHGESQTAVEVFIGKMNEKAEELGLTNTFFVTPNGLDGEATLPDGTVRAHQTTAAELARILRYCIQESPKKEEFLAITRTASYSFSELEGTRSYSCTNHNAFLQMMEGALTGKTGFTAKAGYCYVGALRRDDRTFIVALLACGWPNNRSYKWVDAKKLMNYGLEQYVRCDVYQKDLMLSPLRVYQGVPASGGRSDTSYVRIGLSVPEKEQTLPVLLRRGEEAEIIYRGKESLTAPVQAGEMVGTVQYRIKDLVLAEYPVQVQESVEKLDFRWCLRKIVGNYLPAG